MPDSPSMQSLIFLYGPVLESSHGTISSISLITGLALFGWVENITFLSILQLISAAQLHCPLPLFSIVLFFFFFFSLTDLFTTMLLFCKCKFQLTTLLRKCQIRLCSFHFILQILLVFPIVLPKRYRPILFISSTIAHNFAFLTCAI